MEEEVPLLLGRKAQKLHRVVADDQVGVEERLLAHGRHRLQRLGGDAQPVADAGGVDHHVIRPAKQDLSAHRRDHANASCGWPERSTAVWRPKCPAWQIATARASAAWSEAGG